MPAEQRQAVSQTPPSAAAPRAGPGRAPFHAIFAADAQSVRCALGAVTARLVPGFGDEAAGTAEIVLAEVLNNIVEHAYGGGGGPVELRLDGVPGGLLCTVTDRGRPMPGGALPKGRPQAPPARIEDLPEGGFGWILIRDLAEDLHYTRSGGRNVLTLRLPLV